MVPSAFWNKYTVAVRTKTGESNLCKACNAEYSKRRQYYPFNTILEICNRCMWVYNQRRQSIKPRDSTLVFQGDI